MYDILSCDVPGFQAFGLKSSRACTSSFPSGLAPIAALNADLSCGWSGLPLSSLCSLPSVSAGTRDCLQHTQPVFIRPLLGPGVNSNGPGPQPPSWPPRKSAAVTTLPRPTVHWRPCWVLPGKHSVLLCLPSVLFSSHHHRFPEACFLFIRRWSGLPRVVRAF